MSRPPNTISDREWRRLQEGARKSAPPQFSKESQRRIRADEAQRRKARWS